MNLKTVGYRIEAAAIPQYPGVSRQVWFLDVVQESPDGKRSTSNICNGERQYCVDTMNNRIAEEQHANGQSV